MSKLRILKPKNYIDAYSFRAKYYNNISMISGRSKFITFERLSYISKYLNNFVNFDGTQKVLDIGCGDGTLYELLWNKIRYYDGLDISKDIIHKLNNKFSTTTKRNHGFKVGFSNNLPYKDKMFDVIIINSVLHILKDKKDVQKSIEEISRVSKKNAIIFFGEIPLVNEAKTNSIISRSIDYIRYNGIKHFFYNAFEQFIYPVLKSEPFLIEPADKCLYFSIEEFMRLCFLYNLKLKIFENSIELKKSKTRNDYVFIKQ